MIVLLSIFGKIMPRLILNRLNSLLALNILPETQGPFQRLIDAIHMTFTLPQVKCMEQNMQMLAVCIDFTKAFDTFQEKHLGLSFRNANEQTKSSI